MTTDTYYTNDLGQSEIIKDPNEALDYGFVWTDYLAAIGDTIVSATEVVATGITKDSAGVYGTIHQVKLSGGTEGEIYRIQSRITTLSGNVANRSIYIKIEDR